MAVETNHVFPLSDDLKTCALLVTNHIFAPKAKKPFVRPNSPETGLGIFPSGTRVQLVPPLWVRQISNSVPVPLVLPFGSPKAKPLFASQKCTKSGKLLAPANIVNESEAFFQIGRAS